MKILNPKNLFHVIFSSYIFFIPIEIKYDNMLFIGKQIFILGVLKLGRYLTWSV